MLHWQSIEKNFRSARYGNSRPKLAIRLYLNRGTSIVNNGGGVFVPEKDLYRILSF